ncbi:MAG: FAD-dependent oxidoreductase [Sediminibacterium sp.]|nr:FAD-dependent oxidoreductase [Sediminibacterium sp.]
MKTQMSVWEKETYFNHRDIIIIGSGFVGLWTALALVKKNPTQNILIVDQGIIPTGASTRNAGFACFGSISELILDNKKLGQDVMLQIVEKRFKGIEKIKKYFPKNIIDYKNWGGYELFTNQQYATNTLQYDIQCMNNLLSKTLKKKNVFQMANDKISHFQFRQIKNLVFNPHEGQLHSAKLLEALTQEAISKGVKIMQNIHIKKIHNYTNQVILECKQHIELKANRVIICTNAFAKKLMSSIDIIPARGQVLLTEPITNLQLKGTFHFDEGYYYFRNLDNRILLGGARNIDFKTEQTHTFNTTENIQQTLENFLYNTILPKNIHPKITMRWSGIMAMGAEKTPIVKKINDQIIVAVRMNGMGVAIAPIIGEEVAEL